MVDDPRKTSFEAATDIVDRASSSSPRLLAVWEGGSKSVVLPSAGVIVIGRGEEADVRIEHASISRKHARLQIGPELVIEDLKSANGIWVAGKKLAPGARAPIAPGDAVELGAVMIAVQAAASEEPDVDSHVSEAVPASVRSPAMAQVRELVDLVAQSRLSVILLGETGVGKEVLATRIHERSVRRTAELVKVNCAALMESLLEAELFGYEKGAFTGALQAKPGLIEAAHGGTLFLDEVGELPLSTQAKLLRVLESGEVTRVGSVRPRKVDVRIVAATNRDLRERVEVGQFRRDLFFRLDGASIRIPPLRERLIEIPTLAHELVRAACVEQGRAPLTIEDDAMARLQAHSWPGNVRELRNVVNRAVVFCKDPSRIRAADIRFEDLGAAGPVIPVMGSVPAAAPLSASGSAERARILDALEKSAGNQTRAAKLLGISRRTLVTRLGELGIPRPRGPRDEDD